MFAFLIFSNCAMTILSNLTPKAYTWSHLQAIYHNKTFKDEAEKWDERKEILTTGLVLDKS
jgi:hypothetical protein